MSSNNFRETLLLAVPSLVTYINKSECFISAAHIYAILNFVYDIGSWSIGLGGDSSLRGREFKSKCRIPLHIDLL